MEKAFMTAQLQNVKTLMPRIAILEQESVIQGSTLNALYLYNT